MSIKKLFLLGLSGVLLTACQSEMTSKKPSTAPEGDYQYHNLLASDKQVALVEDLLAVGISQEKWSRLLPYVERYNSENKGYEPVQEHWTREKLGKDQSEFTTFMDEAVYEEKVSHFIDDLNCRRAAFLLIHDLIESKSDLAGLGQKEHVEFTDIKSRHAELTKADQQLYSLLFADNATFKSVDDLLASWKKVGLTFPEEIKLVSAVQDVEGAVIHLHAALAYEKEGKVILFEKIDPALPYRVSQFDSWKDLENHWLSNRFVDFAENMAILVNDQKIADL